jgi:hypothetical protein
MAKESWSARLDTELKKEVQEFLKESDYTNEDIVISGFNTLKNLQTNNFSMRIVNYALFDSAFDLEKFVEIDISSLSRADLQYKLCSIYFWKPYDILLQLRNGNYLYVKSVNESINEICFSKVGEDIEKVLTLEKIINEIEIIEKIYELKQV